MVLLDVNMPGGGGARAAVDIREGLPDVKIVAISADDSQDSQYDMMRAGAVGFLAKGSSDDEILRVIRSSACWCIAQGECFGEFPRGPGSPSRNSLVDAGKRASP